ncbi:hypothetical protein [Algoriphagus boritolerans]|uniref:hypothetical protein n=1 Tax=Algoriphagus boritolerans TaxID=308111 RepID=UPI000A9F77AD
MKFHISLIGGLIVIFFPARGAVVHGELEGVDFSYLNGKGKNYNINSVYGKGLISAYEKAESQNWAGTVVDQSIIDYLEANGESPKIFLEPWCVPHMIPYKSGYLTKKGICI